MTSMNGTTAPAPNRRLLPPLALAALLALGLLPSLTGCVGLAIGAGATAGLAAYSERGIKVTAEDTATATKVHAKLIDADSRLFTDVGVEVFEGRVLLTGRVPNAEMRATAVRLAWSVKSVKDVINELVISANPLADVARDTWITTQLKSELTFDPDIYAINYSVETVGGIIYLIGIAQDQAELDRVLRHARTIKYVKRVVNHVRIKKPTETEATKEPKAS